VPAQIIVRAISAGTFQHPGSKVVPRQQAHERVAPRNASAPGQRQDHRHHHRARMSAAAEIVELQGMRGGAVDEGGLRRRQGIVAPP